MCHICCRACTTLSYRHLCTKTTKTIYLNFLRDARNFGVCDDSGHVCHIFLEDLGKKIQRDVKGGIVILAKQAAKQCNIDVKTRVLLH